MRIANVKPLPSTTLYGVDNGEFEVHDASDAFSLASESDIDDVVFMPVGGRGATHVRCVRSFICLFYLLFFLTVLLYVRYFLNLNFNK